MLTRDIAGLKLTAEKLPAARSLPLFLKASKVLAPASSLIEAVMLDADSNLIVSQFFGFMGDADPDQVTAIIFELAACCTLDGAPFDPRDNYELPTILGAAWLAAEVNFVSFLLASRGSDDPTSPESVAA